MDGAEPQADEVHVDGEVEGGGGGEGEGGGSKKKRKRKKKKKVEGEGEGAVGEDSNGMFIHLNPNYMYI